MRQYITTTRMTTRTTTMDMVIATLLLQLPPTHPLNQSSIIPLWAHFHYIDFSFAFIKPGCWLLLLTLLSLTFTTHKKQSFQMALFGQKLPTEESDSSGQDTYVLFLSMAHSGRHVKWQINKQALNCILSSTYC